MLLRLSVLVLLVLPVLTAGLVFAKTGSRDESGGTFGAAVANCADPKWFRAIVDQIRGSQLRPNVLFRSSAEPDALSGPTPAAPPQHHEQWQQCALVGNSGALRQHAWGTQIDAADIVFRLNQAPTAEYTSLVGARASFRLLNRKWSEKYGDVKAHRHLRLPLERNVTLVLSRVSSQDAALLIPRIREAMSALQRADVRVSMLDSRPARLAKVTLERFRECRGSEKKYIGGRSATSGLLAVMSLFSVCKNVSTYGVGDRITGSATYHYYKLRGTELARGYAAHSFSAERDFFKGLRDAGLLTLCGNNGCRGARPWAMGHASAA